MSLDQFDVVVPQNVMHLVIQVHHLRCLFKEALVKSGGVVTPLAKLTEDQFQIVSDVLKSLGVDVKPISTPLEIPLVEGRAAADLPTNLQEDGVVEYLPPEGQVQKHPTGLQDLDRAVDEHFTVLDMEPIRMDPIEVARRAAEAGALANLTVREFEARKFNTDTNLYEISVSKHKTDESYGPASLFLTPEDVKMMMAYKNTCRVAQPDTTTFFTATNGNSMPSSNISDSLKSFVKRCGVNIQKTINATQIRKMWVSHFEMVGKGEVDMINIAILMKHSRETAKSWYDMTRKVGQAESAHSMIRGELSSLVAAAPPAPAFPRSSTSVEPETSGVDRVNPYDYSSVLYKWTTDQTEVLRKAFRKIISLESNFRVADVRHVFANNVEANNIWNLGRTEVWRDRCVEKVKNMRKADKAAKSSKSTSF
ncbi:hypothetical protein AC249_AIPGENE19982 [Exaiptasia diaphana]|nr:hypothetical protein AC249_AIPGENE19982 [Exaiptasia diaphana]